MKKLSLYSFPSFLFVGLLLTGCTPTLKTVRIKPDPSVVGASVQVDVVAVNSSNQSVIDYPVSKYWLPGDPMRASALKKIQFDSAGLGLQTINIPAGTKEVAIIADLPGLFGDSAGSGDPRRTILLGSGKGVTPEVDVTISRNSVRVVTPTR